MKNFNMDDFLDGLDEICRLIEWRGGLKKKPKGGWPYKATVLHPCCR